MEFVKVIAKNGREMYFQVVDGKKKRVSKEVALGSEIKPQSKSKAKKSPATKAKKASKASKAKQTPKAKSGNPETISISFSKEFIAKCNETIKKALDKDDELELRIEGLFTSAKEEAKLVSGEQRTYSVLEKKRTTSKTLLYPIAAYLYLYLGNKFEVSAYDHFHYADIETDVEVKQYDKKSLEKVNLMASLGYNYPLVHYEITLPDRSVTTINYLRSSTEKERKAFFYRLYSDPKYIKRALDAYLNLAKHGYTFQEGATFIATCFIMDNGNLGFNRYPNPTKNNEMGFKDLFARTLQWVGNDYANEQDEDVGEATRKQFEMGTYILEWIRDNKPKFMNGVDEETIHFSYQANQDNDAWNRLDMNKGIDLKKWKAFEKIVMAKKNLKWY